LNLVPGSRIEYKYFVLEHHDADESEGADIQYSQYDAEQMTIIQHERGPNHTFLVPSKREVEKLLLEDPGRLQIRMTRVDKWM
jgi:hypothetical protein